MKTNRLVSDERLVRLSRCVLSSYHNLLGQPLLGESTGKSDEQLAALLYELPAVVLSHDGAPNPTFTFANLAAQRLFEYPWDEFLTLWSRQSAEPDQRSSREEMLARAAKDGYISDYQGVRISASGKRFEIKNAVIWNVSDERGHVIGQAAVFDAWKMLAD